MMDSRVVNRIEEIYRQDAKATERTRSKTNRENKVDSAFNLQTSLLPLCELGVLAVNFFDSIPGFGLPPWNPS
jgi:hypothetical protein